MDTWTFNWFFWGVGCFLAYELAALALKGRTLSRQMYNWFSLGQHKRYWATRRIVFVTFWLSLGGHFTFQWPALWSVIVPGLPFASVIVLSSFVWKDATVGVAKKE